MLHPLKTTLPDTVLIQGVWYHANPQVIEALNQVNKELEDVYDLIAAMKLKEETAREYSKKKVSQDSKKVFWGLFFQAKDKLYNCLPHSIIKQAELWR